VAGRELRTLTLAPTLALTRTGAGTNYLAEGSANPADDPWTALTMGMCVDAVDEVLNVTAD